MKPQRNQRLEAVVAQLDDIDRAVIGVTGRYRLICARQLRRLFFPDEDAEGAAARRARYRMARLVKLGVVARLPRRVGGFQPGSAGYVYRLDTVGLRLLRRPVRRRSWTPGDAWVRHALAVTETYVQLAEMEQQGLVALLTHDPEPACWRTWTGIGSHTETLKPDAAVVLRTHGWEAHWFLEIDRGTESRTVLRQKLDRYLTYFQTGQEQERLGLFPQVRFIVTLSGSPTLHTEAQRVEEIESVIGELPELAQRLFVAMTLDDFTNRIRAGPDAA